MLSRLPETPMSGNLSLVSGGIPPQKQYDWAALTPHPVWLHLSISDSLALPFIASVLGPLCSHLHPHTFIQLLFTNCLLDTKMFRAFDLVLKELAVDQGTPSRRTNTYNHRQCEVSAQKMDCLGNLDNSHSAGNGKRNKISCVTKDVWDAERMTAGKREMGVGNAFGRKRQCEWR